MHIWYMAYTAYIAGHLKRVPHWLWKCLCKQSWFGKFIFIFRFRRFCGIWFCHLVKSVFQSLAEIQLNHSLFKVSEKNKKTAKTLFTISGTVTANNNQLQSAPFCQALTEVTAVVKVQYFWMCGIITVFKWHKSLIVACLVYVILFGSKLFNDCWVCNLNVIQWVPGEHQASLCMQL